MPSLSAPLLGLGGCFSTYLAVSSRVTLSIALALRMRKRRNVRSRGIGNLSCILAYTIAEVWLFGSVGVSGLGDSFHVTTVLRRPIAVLGTIGLSPVLLVLEGESSRQNQRGVGHVSGDAKASNRSSGIPFHSLDQSNWLLPVVIEPIVAFYAATLYVILLRGWFFFGSGIPKSYGDAFAMAEQTATSIEAIVLATRVAGSGVWNAPSIVGPIIHLVGVLLTIPSIFLLLQRRTEASRAQVLFALRLNLFPLLFCKGRRALQAISLIGIIGGFSRLYVCNYVAVDPK